MIYAGTDMDRMGVSSRNNNNHAESCVDGFVMITARQTDTYNRQCFGTAAC